MAEVAVHKEQGSHGGRYVAKVAGVAGEAELTFTQRSPGVVSADHTGAPDNLRGTGAARALVDFMIADARREGFKIVPICPYVRAQYAKNPDWRDVMTVAPGEASASR